MGHIKRDRAGKSIYALRRVLDLRFIRLSRLHAPKKVRKSKAAMTNFCIDIKNRGLIKTEKDAMRDISLPACQNAGVRSGPCEMQ